MTAQDVASVAITRLIAAYAQFMDSRDIDSLVELFVEDGSLAFPGVTVRGREELAARFENAPRGVHVMGLPLITVDPTANSARSRAAFVFLADNEQRVGRGHYDDALVHRDGRWLFQARRLDIRPAG